MPRKFVGTREIAFVNSITRELHQHVVDEEVYYYAILLDRTKVDDLYNEAIKKAWAPPVKVTARVLYDNTTTKSGLFGPDSEYASEVYFHTQELNERNLRPREGDFVEYGQVFYEITSVTKPQLIYGQVNNKLMTKCKLVPAREEQFAALGDSAKNRDNSHQLDNQRSWTRQNPDPTVATYANVRNTVNLFPVYFEDAADPGPSGYTAAFVTSLTGSVSAKSLSDLQNQPSMGFNAGLHQYSFFALPTSFGAVAANFLDAQTMFPAGVSVVASGVPVTVNSVSFPYDLWRSNQSQLGGWKIDVEVS